jgi:hypothetical protein
MTSGELLMQFISYFTALVPRSNFDDGIDFKNIGKLKRSLIGYGPGFVLEHQQEECWSNELQDMVTTYNIQMETKQRKKLEGWVVGKKPKQGLLQQEVLWETG